MKRVTTDTYFDHDDKILFQVLDKDTIFLDYGNQTRDNATELRDALDDWLGDSTDLRTSQVSFHNFLNSADGRRMLLKSLDEGVLGTGKVWYINDRDGLGYHEELPIPSDPVDF